MYTHTDTNATQTWACTHSLLIMTFAEDCAHTHTTHTYGGNFTQLLVSWVNLFGRSWIWQSSFSTSNNTETNEFISSTPLFSSASACTLVLALSFSLQPWPLSRSASLAHTPLHFSAIGSLFLFPSSSRSPLLDLLSLPAQMVSVAPLSLNYSVNYCGKMCN